MKRITHLLIALAGISLMLTPAASIAVQAFADYPLPTIGACIGLGYMAYKIQTPHLPGIFTLGVQKEIWTTFIADNLFKGVEFLKNCFRADEYVLQGKVVHIPQAGGPPTVVKNRSSLPATAAKRVDTDVTYPLDEFSTDPVIIPDADKVELSYSKMESVFGDHRGALTETAADNILIAWAPSLAAKILRTTGSVYAAHLPSATGNRKGLAVADIKAAKIKLDKDKVPKTDRYCLMSSDMWAQLEDELKATSSRDFSRVNDPESGIIARLYGFSIIDTASMPIYDNAGTPVKKAYGAAGAAADNESVLCWQKNYLELALGEIKFFDDENNPLYYGDVHSALVRMGGRIRYTGEKGVVAIVQVP